MKKSVATKMNRAYKLISLPANLLLAAAVSPAIFTLLTIKRNTLKQQRKDFNVLLTMHLDDN